MKKITLIFAMCIFCLLGTYKVEALVEKNRDDLGRTINAVKADYFSPNSILQVGDILDPQFLKSLVRNKVTRSTSDSDVVYSTSLLELHQQFSTLYKSQVGMSTSYELFSGSLNSTFSTAFTSKTYQKLNQYYFGYFYYKTSCIKTLPDAYNYAWYQNNLSNTYKQDLQKLNNGNMTYPNFFEKYGTHLVASAIYGGRLNITYTVTSEQVYISDSIANEYTHDLKGKYDKNSVGINTSYDFNELSLLNGFTVNTNYRAYTVGGDVLLFPENQGDITNIVNSWISSINESNSEIIEFSENGLIPLWELVPNEYENVRSKMQSEFYIYAHNYYYQLPYMKTHLDSNFIRATEYTISDTDPYDTEYDNIELIYWPYGRTYQYLDRPSVTGWNNITIGIEFDAREVHDGYQEIYLYKGDTRLYTLVFEHTPGKLDTKWKKYSLSFPPQSTSIIGNNFKIRYGAYGNDKDDWKIRNLKVTIYLS